MTDDQRPVNDSAPPWQRPAEAAAGPERGPGNAAPPWPELSRPWESAGVPDPGWDAATPAGAGPRPAPISARIGSGLIDVVLLGAAFWAYGTIFGSETTTVVEGVSGSTSTRGFSVSGGPFLLWLLLAFGYFFVMELLFAGTVGKLLTGLRVCQVDGSRAGAAPIAARTILRVADGFPYIIPNLVGLICLASTGARRQRIGDIAAGTVVIRPIEGPTRGSS